MDVPVPLVWSPDGKRLGLGIQGTGPPFDQKGLVVDLERGELTGGIYCHERWGGFKAWTSDSRYAIYSAHDQYGNSNISVFDVWKQELVIETRCKGGMEGSCKWGFVAVSTVAPDILLRNGTLVQLPDINKNTIISGGYVQDAAWSPAGNLLAFVVCQQSVGSGCVLCLAQGDGSQVQRVGKVTNDRSFLLWSLDGQLVVSQDYVLDVMTKEIQSLTRSETIDIWLTDPCGDVTRFMDQWAAWQFERNIFSVSPYLTWQQKTKYFFKRLISGGKPPPPGEVKDACWSPDRALLAVSSSDELKIYDTHLQLLRTISISGTVERIAWSPIP